MLISTVKSTKTITQQLQERYALVDEVDLKEIAPLMLELKEVLPAQSYKFLLTLCESVFSKLDPELVQVPVMTKKLEAALSAQAKSLGKRGGGDAVSEQPDRLFDRLAGALSSMLRDVVPDHEKCVREARGRAIVEAEAAEQAALQADKAAAKQAKKEKMRQEAAQRRERLKKDKGDGKSGQKQERTSDDEKQERTSEPTGSRESGASSPKEGSGREGEPASPA